ncbi:MAG: PfkB family carbohydrate kinase, partial [Candidatus Dormibacteraeota bacterium]|nr:PfkB family carbohydrate kinase [Candidatus Dormibacteraeota bacterium]
MTQGTLVVGTITQDFVESPVVRLAGELGGSAAYFALAARHFGPVAVVAPVGRDREADARQALEFADLTAVEVVDSPTCTWRARRQSASGDAETIDGISGSMAGYRPDVGGAAAWPDVILLGSIDPAAQLAVAAAAPAGTLVAADTMDVFIRQQREQVGRVLVAARVLLGTEAEVVMLAGGETDAPASLLMSRFDLDAVVVKRGAEGAELWTPATVYELPAYPVDAVDPTGAGDALAGGFLGRLAQRLPGEGGRKWPRHPERPALRSSELLEALRWGVVCASFAVERAGLRGLLDLTRERLWDRMSG